jgi:hypothetical protein
MCSEFEYNSVEGLLGGVKENAIESIQKKRKYAGDYKVDDKLFLLSRNRNVYEVIVKNITTNEYDTVFTIQLVEKPSVLLASRHRMFELYPSLRIAAAVMHCSDNTLKHGKSVEWVPMNGNVTIGENGKLYADYVCKDPVHTYKLHSFAIYLINEKTLLKVWIEDIIAIWQTETSGEGMTVIFEFVLRDTHGYFYNTFLHEGKMMAYSKCLEHVCL